MLERSSPDLHRCAAEWIRIRLRDGLELLSLAARYADADSVNAGHFSVAYASLQERGLNECDIRWLVSQSFIEHLSELTLPGDATRSFRNGGALISDRSCFQLTEAGNEFAVNVLQETNGKQKPVPHQDPAMVPISNSSNEPTWDADRQELWFREMLVKRFRLPSPNQVAVLSAFQEEEWPARIDDPLPPRPEQDPKRRLNDTIRNLNRSHKRPLLRFLGDGSGQGVLWESIH